RDFRAAGGVGPAAGGGDGRFGYERGGRVGDTAAVPGGAGPLRVDGRRLCCGTPRGRSEEHTSELQSQSNLVCRLLLEKKYRSQFSLGKLLPETRARRRGRFADFGLHRSQFNATLAYGPPGTPSLWFSAGSRLGVFPPC